MLYAAVPLRCFDINLNKNNHSLGSGAGIITKDTRIERVGKHL